jgi:hypothetical protein
MSIVHIASLFAGTAGAEIVGPDRRITWTPGVSGGIPHRTTVCATLRPSGGDDGAAIATAVKNCPAEGVVMLSAGTFTLFSGFNVNKNVTVRGAGPGSTILNITGSGHQKVSMGGSAGMTASIAVTGGHTRGSTNITVADASAITGGDFLLIDQKNDTTETTVNHVGTGGACKWCNDLDDGSGDGTRALGQLIRVAGKSFFGNTLTLEKGLYWNYVAAAAPGVRKLESLVDGAGIEDLQVTQGTAYPVRNLITMTHCSNCWIKNVELKNGRQRHLEVTYSYQFEVRDSYFHLADSYGQDHGYCVSLWDGATDGLVENNIMAECLLAVAFNGPCAGNVIAYNYSTDVQYTNSPTFQEGDFATHGAHPYFNLFEGNLGIMAQHDNYWGSSSHNVWFRNRLFGWQPGRTDDLHAALLDAQQTYLTFVGNILGTPHIRPAYVRYETENLTADCYANRPDIYKLGYQGGTGDCSASGNDPQTKATLMRHGNYDYFNRAVLWEPAIADRNIPDSLYLSGKPGWWGNLTWPPVNPLKDPSTFGNITIPARERYLRAAVATPPAAAYTVTPSAGPNGSFSPNTARMVNDGETAQFTVTPAAGYAAAVGGACGGTLTGTTYTTSAIKADCTVAATFAALPGSPEPRSSP